MTEYERVREQALLTEEEIYGALLKADTEYERKMAERKQALRENRGLPVFPYFEEMRRLFIAQAQLDKALKADGIEIKSDDQSLPNADRLKAELKKQGGYHTARTKAYALAQQDMLKAGFIKVIPKEE